MSRRKRPYRPQSAADSGDPPWKKEFGTAYRPPDVILDLIDAGLPEDLSWHNDASPSFGFTNDEGDRPAVRIWVQHPNHRKREHPEVGRFIVDYSDDMGSEDDFETDDPELAIAVYLDWLKKAGLMPKRRRRR